MSELERRYRGLLRVLPSWYRAQREAEMVTTFMAGRRDRDDRATGWPGWPEFWAVLALAVTTRVGARHGPRRAVALGDIVRLAGLLGLLALVPRAVAGLLDALGDLGSVTRPDYLGFGLIAATHVAAVGGLVAVVTARRALGRVLAAVAVATSLATLMLPLLPNAAELALAAPWRIATVYVPVWVAVGCLLVGFTREAPEPPARPWLLACAGAVLLTVVWTVVRDALGLGSSVTVVGDLGSAAGWAAILTAIALPFLRHRIDFNFGQYAFALAIMAAAMLPDRLNYLDIAGQLVTFDGLRGPWVATAIQVAGLAAAAVALGTVGVRDYRRLPSPWINVPAS